jgi:hypothetical protein
MLQNAVARKIIPKFRKEIYWEIFQDILFIEPL